LSRNTSTIDTLVICGDGNVKGRILSALSEAGITFSSTTSAEDGKHQIAAQRPKIVLCDCLLSDGDGLSLCARVRENEGLAGTYFLLFSTEDRGDLASCGLDAGADDFLRLTSNTPELVARVRVGLRIWTMQDQLRQAARTDGLTSLHNHAHFNRTLGLEMARTHRYGHPMALMLIDLDFFKAINDSFGHPVGDATLQATAKIIRDSVRDLDTVGRLGGEEFGVVLPESTTTDAMLVAERLRVALTDAIHLPQLRDHVVTASFGVADSDDPRVRRAEDLMDLADRALYMAKRCGRNQVRACHEVNDTGEVESEILMDEVDNLRRRLAVLSARAKDVYVQSVASLLQALDEKDPYTARHAVNVAFYAEQIAEQMDCSRATVKSVHNAGLLHDIGKVGMPDRILMKHTPLTPLERRVIEQAPAIGARIVDHLRILESEVQIIRHQREYYDGSGFPNGLGGNRIPIGSRILLLADAFDAMTTNRIYRERRPIDEVMKDITGLAGKQFDPVAVKAMQHVLAARREQWQQRIDDTLTTMQLPSENRISAAEGPL
jgi:diguanylate cyclase (GGDEF)-like protein/putative nucleotidyltransferase with HDIG domain